MDIPWITTTMENHVAKHVGDIMTGDCKTHRIQKHTLIGKRTVQIEEQAHFELQWFCHRCAKELSALVDKDTTIEMMIASNARMGQGG